MTRPPGARVDHYKLVEHLADGAQAEVHHARDLKTGEDVVIKFPHSAVLDQPALVGRWRRESALTESLSHPNIQCRCDVGEHHGEPYQVLEYASGGSLGAWVGAEPLPVGQVVEWGRQLAQALAFLHHLGIVHRDVKPANLLVTDDLTIKLADFGAAVVVGKRHRSWLPFPPVIEGTAEYLSPEQAAGQEGDARSDIYSWGVMMYELLSGRVPFTGPDRMTAIAARLTQSASPLRSLRPEVPPGLEAIIMTAMRRFPERRYPDAHALLADLDRVDDLDPADFDLGPDPPYAAGPHQTEWIALARFSGVVAAGFLVVVAGILLLTITFR
jgi:eukaryotic-like serine/threonine-protein kinase